MCVKNQVKEFKVIKRFIETHNSEISDMNFEKLSELVIEVISDYKKRRRKDRELEGGHRLEERRDKSYFDTLRVVTVFLSGTVYLEAQNRSTDYVIRLGRRRGE